LPASANPRWPGLGSGAISRRRIWTARNRLRAAFSIAYELLTVTGERGSALRLRVADLEADERETRIDDVLRKLASMKSRREVRVLSGGQKRRLALALEMVSSPHLLSATK